MKALAVAIAQKLYYYYPELKVYSSHQVGGGVISAAMELETSEGKFFVKFNSDNRFPGMFESEKRGLELLASAHTQLIIPEPILCDVDSGGTSFLLMEYLEADIPDTISGGISVFGWPCCIATHQSNTVSNSTIILDHCDKTTAFILPGQSFLLRKDSRFSLIWLSETDFSIPKCNTILIPSIKNCRIWFRSKNRL